MPREEARRQAGGETKEAMMDEIKSLSDELRSRVCIAQERVTDEEKLTAEEVNFATQTAISSMSDQVFISITVQYPTDEAMCYITSMRDKTVLVHIAANGSQFFKVFPVTKNPTQWIVGTLRDCGIKVADTVETVFNDTLH